LYKLTNKQANKQLLEAEGPSATGSSKKNNKQTNKQKTIP